MTTRRFVLGATLLCATFGVIAAGADQPAPSAQGPWLGVWKLNIEKSNFQTNKPPAGTDRTYAMTAAGPDSFNIVIDSKTPEGVQQMHMVVEGAKFDGKPYKEVGNHPAQRSLVQLRGNEERRGSHHHYR